MKLFTEARVTSKGGNKYVIEFVQIDFDDNIETFFEDKEELLIEDSSLLNVLDKVNSKEAFWAFVDMIQTNDPDLYDPELLF